ncbi:OPT family oligopeptide transporter [Tundrisphaera lichenicola]|uniref:OPT family oligopeptide transporter n=1 Tax=Tundrisphaera lichenicola TaxID=2029860 RepID=UPI003EB76B03
MSVHPPPEPAVSGTPDGESGSTHRAYVADSTVMPELTWSAVTLGAILGIIFGASSLYLVLRVGMTVSASIPVAVLSITLFRFFSRATGSRPATILENNIVQTTGSAGESIAFGIGVTMPALMILGYDMRAVQVMLVAALGGLLGILMMIPLRRAFIVKQHGSLAYPEGTACAKVLIVGEQGGSSARTVFTGFGMAFLYQFCMEALKLWNQYPARGFEKFKGAVLSCEVSPILLGVGYIIGPRIASVTFAGGVLAYLVLTPTISLFGQGSGAIFPGTKPIGDMSAKDIRDAYILYIGAGAVAAGGVISLLQALPLILGSIKSGLGDLARSGGGVSSTARTERDLPLWLVGVGSTLLVAAIAATGLFPTEVDLTGRIAGALMIAVFGFLFVTVSSRLTGEIGSSSNPISGMTVATLLLTCLIFVLLGWVGTEYRVAAVSIAGIVCVAASNGGTTSQDLKTGYLVGATPKAQQLSILVGALTSAIVIGFTLLLLNEASTVVTNKAENLPKIAAPDVSKLTKTEAGPDGKEYKVWWVVDPIPGAEAGKYLVDDAGKAVYLIDPAINGRVDTRDDGSKVTKYDAPKARLMALIIDGIMRGQLPWGLVILGALISVLMQLSLVPSLAFAVGVYLPLSTSMPIFVGGLVRVAVDRIKKANAEDSDSSPAVLLSSGYIAGGAIAGILIALLALAPSSVSNALDLSRQLPDSWNQGAWPSLAAFGLMAGVLLLCGLGVFFKGDDPSAVSDGVKGREEDL